jgi:tellurite resistance protein TehA-like permease
MKGWKTILFGVATALLGVLQSTEITNIVAQYPGGVTTTIGFLVVALRLITTSSVFKKEE